jgi:hypothetical protein
MPRRKELKIPDAILDQLLAGASSLASARISRRFSGFCRPFALMYSQTLLTTSPRGSGSGPTTAASSAEGRRGCCSAFGLLPSPPASSFAAALPLGALPLPASGAFALGALAAIVVLQAAGPALVCA